MGTRWAEEIDRSFGDGPTPPAPATYVAAGRAAAHRRRLVVGTASVAAALVVGAVGWASLPGGAVPGAGQVATDPRPAPTAATAPPASPSASPSATTTRSPWASPTVVALADSPDDVREAAPDERELMERGASVAVLADATLVHLAGWTVERLEAQPGSDDSERVWGVVARPEGGGEGEWILLSWSSRGTSSAVWDPPGKRFATFDEWLATTLAEQQGAEVPQVARMRAGDLVAGRDVVVLEAVEAPAEAAAYGPVEEMVAARFRLADGTEIFGLVGPEGTTTVDPAVLGRPTMTAFLRHLAAQGDGGEGLR